MAIQSALVDSGGRSTLQGGNGANFTDPFPQALNGASCNGQSTRNNGVNLRWAIWALVAAQQDLSSELTLGTGLLFTSNLG